MVLNTVSSFLQTESRVVASGPSSDRIREMAKIYRKESLKPYEERINSAAGDICVADPSMLKNKGELLKLARKRVDESGYSYKKGKSRSSVFGTGKEPLPKRKSSPKTSAMND